MFLVCTPYPVVAEEIDFEQAVCGVVREPLAFWLWQSMAGRPDPSHVKLKRNVQFIQFTARDGVVLSGYKLAARVPRGYILVAQGNAMLADQLISDLELFRKNGFDTYIYDYRGYGQSEGKSRLAAIIADYVDIVSHLNARGYTRRFMYGISIGGVILLNAVGRNHNFDAAVIDSSPSYISNYGCPESYNPMRHLPQDSSHIMIISGVRDLIVSPLQMAELIRIGSNRGAFVFRGVELSHPFQDRSPVIHRRRLNKILDFFINESKH
jgi:alpha/beta superfamily hydrolase